MSIPSSVSGLPLPENSDILNAQVAFGDYALGADTRLIPRFATEAARDTAFASGAVAGQMCVVTNSGTFAELMMYDGSVWVNISPGIEKTQTTIMTTTSSTGQNLTGLSFSGRANYIYEYELHIYTSCASTGAGIILDWTIPAGATMTRNMLGQLRISPGIQTNTEIRGGVGATVQLPAGTTTAGGSGVAYAQERGIITMSSTSGTLQVRGCSRGGASISIHPDSNLSVRRIG